MSLKICNFPVDSVNCAGLPRQLGIKNLVMCALNKIAVVLMYIIKVTPTIFVMFAALLSMRGTDFVGMPSMSPATPLAITSVSQWIGPSAANHGTRSPPSAPASNIPYFSAGRDGCKKEDRSLFS